VVVKDGAKIVVIPVDDLDYAEAQDDYIALHSRGQSWLKHQSITSLERTLDPGRFLRVHRSVLVNLDRIVRVEPHGRDSRRATLRDGTELPVSRAGYQRLRALLAL
jgi:two-component system LytT family response regulator